METAVCDETKSFLAVTVFCFVTIKGRNAFFDVETGLVSVVVT